MKLFDYINDRRKISSSNISINVANLAKNHGPFLDQLDSMKSLPVHSGCVNTIEWNKTGEYILSGSDDKCLCITRPTCLFDKSNNYTVLHKISTSHLGNIFSAKFLPKTCDNLIASCSSNGPVIVTDINSENPSQGIFTFNCHTQSTFDIVPIQDDNTVFLSCSEDTTVRLFDLRCHRSCSRSSTCPHPALIRNSHAITKIAIHPLNSNMILVGRADGKGLVYDRRKLPDPAKFSRQQAHAERLADPETVSQKTFQFLHPLDGVVSKFCVPGIENCRFTSLCFSPLGNQVLASFTKDDVYLFNYDKSSRVELDQTFKKSTEMESELDETSTIVKQNYQDALDISQRGDDSLKLARLNHMTRNKERRMGRPHTLRLHGDWSDTGVDSTPRRDPSTNRVNMQTLTNQAFRLLFRQGTLINNYSHSTTNDDNNDNNVTNSETSSTSNNNNTDGNNREDHTYTRLNTETVNTDDLTADDDDGVVSDEEPTIYLNISRSEDNNDSYADDNDDNEDVDSMPDQNTTHQSSSSQQQQQQSSSPANSQGKSKKRGIISPETRQKFRDATEVLKNRYKDIHTYHPSNSYFGHRNRRTIIKQAEFWGDDFIMSGSDCGRIFFWEKESCKIVSAFKGDGYVVNRLAANPHHYVLASSGIDCDIKLWSTQFNEKTPLKPEPEEITKIVENNENMLDETMNTLTVPPQLFFRFLAQLTRSEA